MFRKQVQLFMIFDRLADTVRTGPTLWKVKRKRLEDVKNHILDLLLIARIFEDDLKQYLDMNKVYDYIMCHDLPEAITGDITKFEGVSKEEITRVTNIAIDYLISQFGDIIDFKTIFDSYEGRKDLEAKVVNMIDRIHSSTTFIKYQAEQHIDYDDPDILPILRNHPYVVEKISEGMDVADIFFNFHMQDVVISDDECSLYGISREDADKIVSLLRGFATELYQEKVNGSLFEIYDDLPKNAMIYNRMLK